MACRTKLCMSLLSNINDLYAAYNVVHSYVDYGTLHS